MNIQSFPKLWERCANWLGRKSAPQVQQNKPQLTAFEQHQCAPTWAPTHRHSKGGLYRVLTQGILESDRSPMVIYDDAKGAVWIRPVDEFHDGRFTPLD